MMVNAHWVDLKASVLVLKIIEMHLNMPGLMLFALMAAELAFFRYMVLCIAIYSAVWNGMTLNEFENAWNFKYLYKAKRIKTSEGPVMFYFIKRGNLAKSICNCFRFWFACREAKKTTNKVPEAQQRMEIEMS